MADVNYPHPQRKGNTSNTQSPNLYTSLHSVGDITENPRRLARPKQLASYSYLSLTTIWRLCETDPTFPQRIKITPRLVYFDLDEFDAWLESKKGA